MHYAITGSTGHTARPITEGLLKAGHTVTVITSRAEQAPVIEAMGAKAAVGRVDDADFLTTAFAGADAAYLLIPGVPNPTDWRAAQNQIIDQYIKAVTANEIQFVVLLSSIGADLGQGTGPVDGLYDAEQKLAAVPGLNSKFLRPSYFMYNLLGMAGMLKHMGSLGSNFGADPVVLTHTDDIAAVALRELMNLDFTGHQVRYIASTEHTGAEIARILGTAVGKPDAQWLVFSDEQTKQALQQAGLNEVMAQGYMELGHALRTGSMQADFLANRPPYGSHTLEQFAQHEFAAAYSAA